ncbi:MAG: MoaD/ThiS family protein [Chloroflexi bacterium]|nr:MoaD/ThiS family protein [Chloroflexota bacterium]
MKQNLHITVRFGEPLRRAVGQFRLEVKLPAPATLPDLLAYLEASYDGFEDRYRGAGFGQTYPYRWFVNRTQIGDEEFDTYGLDDGDLIHIMIPVAGGSLFRSQPPDIATQRVREVLAEEVCPIEVDRS